ncbi:hypothetical protein HWV62_14904 [Athelia sp. TMB]|nr:hypothetical protein HWV62_14904 [Athelia sp. TMB]
MGPEYESISRPGDGHGRTVAPDPYSSLYVRPQGLSAYRISQTPVAGGLWNSDQYHFVVLIDKVVKLINHKVGEAFEAPSGLKVPKIPDPSKYTGSSSHEEFMDWLGEFLNWLRGNYICGPRCDALRVNYLGLYLGGSASDWYLTEIDNPDRSYHPALKFADCVALLHKRFVRTATANNAVILYNAVRYNSKDGVEGLFYQLDRAASKMIERPSDYSFRSRLFNCLPRWMQTIMLSRNITPEYHQIIDIRENARQIEENSMRKYEGLDERINSPAAGQAPTATRPMRASPPHTKPNNSRPTSRPTAAEARPPAAPRAPKAPRQSGTRDTSAMTCYSCGEVGHISTQPVCVNYDQNKARLHAQREVDEVSDEDNEPSRLVEAETSGEDYNPTWGGSQYESDPGQEEDISPPDDNVEQARFARMYAAPPRLCAMRSLTDFDTDPGEMADASEDEDLDASGIPSYVTLDVLDGYWIPEHQPEEHGGGTPEVAVAVPSDDESMPDLESAPASEDEDNIADDGPVAHGSDSDPMEDSDEDSVSASSAAVSVYSDYSDYSDACPPVALSEPHANEVRYMDDILHLLPGHPLYQYHDLPAQRVTRPRATPYRLVQDLRPGSGSGSPAPGQQGLPYFVSTDRGAPATMVPGLLVKWRYVGTAPEEHLPHIGDTEFLSPTVWIDRQERFLDFDSAGDLHEYNDLISQIVYCLACKGACTPLVFQQLVYLPRQQDEALHRTTYVCTEGTTIAAMDRDDDGLRSLRTFHSATLMAMRVVHSSTVRRPMGNINKGITRPKQSHTTITCLVDINGHKALALFDSGSTTDSVTPEFAFVSKLQQFTLPEQVTLQLGCIGSRSKICYGTVAPVDVLGIRTEMYFDLINIDRYDAILGTPFLEQHGICLDFKDKAVVIGGVAHKTFSIDEEIAYLVKRGGNRETSIPSSPSRNGAHTREAPQRLTKVTISGGLSGSGTRHIHEHGLQTIYSSTSQNYKPASAAIHAAGTQ